MQYRSLRSALYLSALYALVLILVMAPPWPAQYKAYGLAACACIILVTFTIYSFKFDNALHERVDPWALQAENMRISGQWMPGEPMMHNGVVLYGALQMEELGQTLATLAQLLASPYKTPQQAWTAMSLHQGPNASRMGLGVTLHEMSVELKSTSREVREELSKFEIKFPMPRYLACNLLDDASDVMVVTAGLGLAAGLPARWGYREVQYSNLSKGNPETGVIDKDASGKWIKGRNYRPPALMAVLDAWAARDA